jgi:hypothetical protein
MLENLPLLASKTTRVYIEEIPTDITFTSHLASVLGAHYAKLNFESRFASGGTPGTAVAALISQSTPFTRWLCFQNFVSTPSGRTITTGYNQTMASWCSISLDEERTVGEQQS